MLTLYFVVTGLIALVIVVITLSIKFSTLAGKKGELYVRSILATLPIKDYIIINDIIIKNGRDTTQIDHLVISKYGIFVIETKNYSGMIFGKEKDTNWTQRIGRRSYKLYNPIRQNKRHITNLNKHLNLPVDNFVSIIVFVDKAKLRVNTDTTVLNALNLRSFVRSYKDIIVNEDLGVLKGIILENGSFSRKDKKAHVVRINRMRSYKKSGYSKFSCPNCDGTLKYANDLYDKKVYKCNKCMYMKEF